MHKYISTYIRTYVHTYIDSLHYYIHSYLLTYRHVVSIHPSIQPASEPASQPVIHPYIYIYIYRHMHINILCMCGCTYPSLPDKGLQPSYGLTNRGNCIYTLKISNQPKTRLLSDICRAQTQTVNPPSCRGAGLDACHRLAEVGQTGNPLLRQAVLILVAW